MSEEDQQGKENINPGSWSDEINVPQSFDDFRNKFNADEEHATQEREKLISDSLIAHKITPQYADLLRKIKASTMGVELAKLTKVKIALETHASPDLNHLGAGRVAYIGSGYDWEFPVALGARDIDMVDSDLISSNKMSEQRIIESVKQIDPEVSSGDQRNVSFHIDVGNGPEEVLLHFKGTEADEYIPDCPVMGVLEFNSPDSSNGKLIRDNIMPHLRSGSILFNFDHSKKDDTPDGVREINSSRGSILKIRDIEKLKKWQLDQPAINRVNINEIREKLKERRKEL